MVRLAELLNGDKSVFIEFYASWCPHCQRMRPIIESLCKKEDRLRVQTYDIDSPSNRSLVDYYKVQSVPTMLLFKNGEQVWRQSGEIPLEQLEEIIERFG